MEGWIKIHRKMLDWEWFDSLETVKLFIYLLLKVNHSDRVWKGILIKRGQLLTGLEKMSKETKISIQKLRTCLSRIEQTGEITMVSTNKYRIITICKYDDYQVHENQTNKQTENVQKVNNKQLTSCKSIPVKDEAITEIQTNNQLTSSSEDLQQATNKQLTSCKSIPVKDVGTIATSNQQATNKLELSELTTNKNNININIKEKNIKKEKLDFGILKPEIWQKWIDYKKTQFKFTYKSNASEQAGINNLIKLSMSNNFVADKIVEQSMANGYKGLFPLKENLTQKDEKRPNIPRL